MSFHPSLNAFFSGKTLVSKTGTFESYLDDKERALWSRLDGSKAIEYVMTREAAEPNWFWKTLLLFYTLDLADFKSAPGRETEAAPPPPSQMPEAETAIAKRGGDSKSEISTPAFMKLWSFGENSGLSININSWACPGRPMKPRSRRPISGWPAFIIPTCSVGISIPG